MRTFVELYPNEAPGSLHAATLGSLITETVGPVLALDVDVANH